MTPTKEQVKSRDMAELAEYRRYLNRHPDLKCLFIELTDRCNLYCRHSGSSCSGAGSTFIDTDLICRTIREAGREFEKSHFMICLTGGEPMLHPECRRLPTALANTGHIAKKCPRLPIALANTGYIAEKCL